MKRKSKEYDLVKNFIMSMPAYKVINTLLEKGYITKQKAGRLRNKYVKYSSPLGEQIEGSRPMTKEIWEIIERNL